MNIIQKFQMAALLVTGLSLSALAQEKQTPKVKVKADTTETSRIKYDAQGRPILKTKRNTIEIEKDSIGGDKKVIQGVTLPSAINHERDSAAKAYKIWFGKQPLKVRDSLNNIYRKNKKEIDAGFDKKFPKTIAPQPTNKETVSDTSRVKEVFILRETFRDSIVYETDTVEVKPAHKGRPGQLAIGPTRLWFMGDTKYTGDQLGPIDTHTNIVEGPVNGVFFSYITPTAAEKGIGSIIRGEIFGSFFPKKEFEEYAIVGENDAALYKYKADQSNLLNFIEISAKFGKEIRFGAFGFDPALNFGVHLREKPELEFEDKTVAMDRFTKDALEASQVTMFGEAAADLKWFVIEKEKLKTNKKTGEEKIKQTAVLLFFRASATKLFEDGVQTNPFSGAGPGNGKGQWNAQASLGLAVQF